MMDTFDDRSTPFRRLRVPALGIAAIAVGIGWLVFNPPSLLEPPPEEPRQPRAVGEVRVADISETFEVEGTVEYDRTLTVGHTGSGTITEISDRTGPLASGDVLFWVDNSPTVAVHGSIPAYRTMAIDAVGDDVLQLEQALVELGYDTAGVLNVDGVYTNYTADLVELWQVDLGLEVNGRVAYGDVVFVPPGFEIGTVHASVGDRVNDEPLLELRTTDRLVRFEVGLGDLGSLPVGSVVQVRLPSRESFDAEVTEVVEAGEGRWAVTAQPIDPPGLDDAEVVPVDVTWDRVAAEQATVVSAGAVRRLDSGGYAVEVVGSSDLDTEFVFVEVGATSGRDVQLLEGPPAGTTVIVP